MDGYYAYNLNRPVDQSVGLRGVNVNSDSLQFSAAKLSFNKPTTGPNTVGYRLDLVFGPLADSFLVPYEPVQGISVQRNVLNGYLSYSVPVGKGLNIDVGKFTTFIGAEVFDTFDNWNYQQGVLVGVVYAFGFGKEDREWRLHEVERVVFRQEHIECETETMTVPNLTIGIVEAAWRVKPNFIALLPELQSLLGESGLRDLKTRLGEMCRCMLVLLRNGPAIRLEPCTTTYARDRGRITRVNFS